MTLYYHEITFPRLSPQQLDAWRKLPTAVVADALNRSGAMCAAIKPIRAGVRLVGQARTVCCMVGDNSAIHTALPRMNKDEILVVDACGSTAHAVWGGILTHIALRYQIGGIVIDGAIRDINELCQQDFPVFCRGATPRGPHKGFGGELDAHISAGGVNVCPGDLVLGDDDGVVVVPLNRVDTILCSAQNQMAKERQIFEKIDAGQSSSEIFELPDPTPLDS